VSIANRLQKNLKRLKPYVKQLETNCYRIYDQDIPEFPYSIDIYSKYAVVSHFYSPIDEEPEKRANFDLTLKAIEEVLEILPINIFVKIRAAQKGTNQYEKLGRKYSIINVHEKDALFEVNLSDYLDTGLFLDHRPMRYMIRKMAKGKSFLNLFSYTSTATVHAFMGGARESVSMDLSATYLEWSERNFRLNDMDLDRHELKRMDCLKWSQETFPPERKFDLIFIDPPTFSNSKRMDDVFDIQEDHIKLIERAIEYLQIDGDILFSCNLRSFKLDESLTARFKITDIGPKTIPNDFRDQKIHHAYHIRRKV